MVLATNAPRKRLIVFGKAPLGSSIEYLVLYLPESTPGAVARTLFATFRNCKFNLLADAPPEYKAPKDVRSSSNKFTTALPSALPPAATPAAIPPAIAVCAKPEPGTEPPPPVPRPLPKIQVSVIPAVKPLLKPSSS